MKALRIKANGRKKALAFPLASMNANSTQT